MTTTARTYAADLNAPGKGAATEERTAPLTVPLPDTWPQPVGPVQPDTELEG